MATIGMAVALHPVSGHAQDSPDTSARPRAAVMSCFSSEGSGAAGRVELEAQAHSGELVALVVQSELGNRDFNDCLCRRSPAALAAWAASVDGDALLQLPFVLGEGAATTSAETIDCPIHLVEEARTETAEVTLPPGHMEWGKIKAKGDVDADAIRAALDDSTQALERCYQADLIRWPGYAAKAKLELHIAEDGSTAAALISGLAYNSISNCQVQHLLGVSWPTGPGTVQAKVSYVPGE